MDSLPFELLSEIFLCTLILPCDSYHGCAAKYVRNLRLVNKALAHTGTHFLFRRIRILPSIRSAEQIEYVLANPVYASSVREVVFCFEEEPEDKATEPEIGTVIQKDTFDFEFQQEWVTTYAGFEPLDQSDDEGDEDWAPIRFRIPPAIQSIMSQIPSFLHNVDSIEILLPDRGGISEATGSEWNCYRHYILASISKALSPSFSSPRKLLIYPIPGYIQHLPVPCLPNLEELCLSAVTVAEGIPDHRYRSIDRIHSVEWREALSIFSSSLGEDFLSPYPTIKKLVIGGAVEGEPLPLGWEPIVNFGSVFLKDLRELELDHWVLGSSADEVFGDGLVDFLLKHGESLEVLSIGGIFVVVDYHTEAIRWCQVFETLQGGLQKLRQLEIRIWWYYSYDDDRGFEIPEHEQLTEVFGEGYHEMDVFFFGQWVKAVNENNTTGGQ